FAFFRQSPERSMSSPIQSQTIGSIDTEPEREGQVLEGINIVHLRHSLKAGVSLGFYSGRRGVLAIGRNEIDARAELLPLKLSNASGVVIDSRGIISGRRESIATGDAFGVLIRQTEPDGLENDG